MQLVGSPCHICSGRIFIIAGIHSCPSCEVAWHDACHAPAHLCPKCQGDTDELRAAAEKAQSAADTSAIRKGRWLYFIMLISYLVLWTTVTSRTFAAGKANWPVQEVVRLVIYLALWILAFRGSSGARRTLGVLAAIALVLAPGLISGSPLLVSQLVACGLLGVWAAWFSPQIRAYERILNR